MSTLLLPFQGLLFSHCSPRLAPWALFLRRFAAKSVGRCSTLRCAKRVHTHTLKRSIQYNRRVARLEVVPFPDTTLAKQARKRCPGEDARES